LAALFGLTQNTDAPVLRELLDGLEVRSYFAGEQVMQPHSHAAGNASDASILYVVSGLLEVRLVHTDRHGHEEVEDSSQPNEIHSIYVADAGDTVGHIAVMTGDYHYRVMALSTTPVNTACTPRFTRSPMHPDVVVGRISKAVFDKLVYNNPHIMTRTMAVLLQQVSPFLRQVH
jgi:CRP-like cAMP-binding protein